VATPLPFVRQQREKTQALVFLPTMPSRHGLRRLTSSSQRKGDNYERELSSYLNEITGISSFRAPMSGGGLVGLPGGSDILGSPGLFIEAKRTERLNPHKALEQAERNARNTNAPEHPIVVQRRNHQRTGDSVVHLRLDDFLVFYNAYLASEGYVK
jgi:hypothetical protein